MDLNQLLASVKSRDLSKEGIATALSYMASISPCLGDEACTAKFFQPHGYDAWAKALKDAESRLVYRNADMLTDPASFTSTSGRKNCLGTFDFILTSTRKDRDGDVLESGGAQIDEAMPLLWQHIPLQPIGAYDATLRQDKSFIKSRASIADVPLGYDTCVLIEFGGLRISHGFKPLQFAPLKRDKNDPNDEPGFHITKYVVMEVSTVSVPSNIDAVITAFSREKLCSPLAKAWAKSLKEKLPPMVTSGFQATNGAPAIEVPVVIDVQIKQHGDNGCACNGESNKGTKNDSGAPAGAQQKPNAGGDSANDDMEADLSKAMKGIRHAGNAMGFMHKGDAAAHWTMGDGDGDADDHHKPDDIKAMLGNCKGVKSVACQKGRMPPKDKGWKKLYPKAMDWNNEGESDMNTDGKTYTVAELEAWYEKNKDRAIPVAAIEKACPGCGEKLKAKGFTSVKLSALKAGEPNNMDALCDKIRGEEHPHQTCVDMVEGWGDRAPDDPHKFCGWLQSQCGVPSPRAFDPAKLDAYVYGYFDAAQKFVKLGDIKAGRVLAQQHVDSLQTAHDLLGGASQESDPTKMHAMGKAARFQVKSVIDAHEISLTGGPKQPPAQPGSAPTPGSTKPDATLSTEPDTKGGRVLSKANYAILKDAHDIIATAHGMDDVGQAKGMYKSAQGHIKTVLDAGNASSGMSVTGGDQSPRPLVKPDGDGDGDGDKAAALVRKLTARLLDGEFKGCSGRELKLLRDCLDDALEDIRERRMKDSLALTV